MKKPLYLLFVYVLLKLSLSNAQDVTNNKWEYTQNPEQPSMAYKYRLHCTNVFTQVPAVNSVVHGRMIVYSKEGRRSESFSFIMGKLNGVHLVYDDSGEYITHECSYKNNRLDGFAIEYETNGMIRKIQEYKAGKLLPSDPSWKIADTNNGEFYIPASQ